MFLNCKTACNNTYGFGQSQYKKQVASRDKNLAVQAKHFIFMMQVKHACNC